jgi:hypothetical protein
MDAAADNHCHAAILFQNHISLLSNKNIAHRFTKTKLKLKPVTSVITSLTFSKSGIHGCAGTVVPENVYDSPFSPNAA